MSKLQPCKYWNLFVHFYCLFNSLQVLLHLEIYDFRWDLATLRSVAVVLRHKLTQTTQSNNRTSQYFIYNCHLTCHRYAEWHHLCAKQQASCLVLPASDNWSKRCSLRPQFDSWVLVEKFSRHLLTQWIYFDWGTVWNYLANKLVSE